MKELSANFSSEEELRVFIERGIRGIERWISVCGNAPPSDQRDEVIRYNRKQLEKWQDIYEKRYGQRYVPDLNGMQTGSRGLEKPVGYIRCFGKSIGQSIH